MNHDGVKLMARLTDHIKAQMDTRATEGYKKSIRPPKSVSAERKAIMDEVVKFIGLPLKELQVKLAVNRTTWERWERMESIPKRSHLDYLRRLMEDAEKKLTRAANQQFLPKPAEYISEDPRTYGQLRVLFFHRAYNWEDAIFHFQTPFQDAGYIVDLASLALNGCKVVYIMKASKLKPTDWSDSFVKNMSAALGVRVANQVLAGLCILEVNDDEDSLPPDFGILNFESGKNDEKVGYIWIGKPGNDSSHFVTQPNQYYAIPATAKVFYTLKLQYNTLLGLAFDAITKNRAKPAPLPEESYDESERKFAFTISIIDQQGTPKELTVHA